MAINVSYEVSATLATGYEFILKSEWTEIILDTFNLQERKGDKLSHIDHGL